MLHWKLVQDERCTLLLRQHSDHEICGSLCIEVIKELLLLFPVDHNTHNVFSIFIETFLMPHVRFKPISLFQMYQVIGLKQTCGIKNILLWRQQKNCECWSLLGRVKYIALCVCENWWEKMQQGSCKFKAIIIIKDWVESKSVCNHTCPASH